MNPAITACDALLTGLFDHAVLFPPASLTPREALEEDRRARVSAWSAILGRFVCRATVIPQLGDEERALSVVLDGSVPDDPRIEAVEALHLEQLSSLVELANEVYVEVPVDDELESRLAELARLGLLAKIRCGGESTPGVGELARFVRECRELGLAFKATAGLHHAVRGAHGHGFLNLLAAVLFGDEENALSDTGADAFSIDDDAFRWRQREAGVAQIEFARRGLFRSIGSCSFFEPVEALEALGVSPPSRSE